MAQHQNLERRVLQLLLLLADAVAIAIAFALALGVRFGFADLKINFLDFISSGKYPVIFLIYVFSFYLFDLYEPRSWRTPLFSPLKTSLGSGLATILMFSWFYFFAALASGVYGRGVFLSAIAVTTVLALITRYFVARYEMSSSQKRQWLFVGDERCFNQLKSDLKRQQISSALAFVSQSVSKLELQKKLSQDWTGVIVGLGAPPEITAALMASRLQGQVILSLQSFYEFYCGKLPVHSLDDAWFAYTEGFSILHSPLSVRLKRFSDIVISFTFLVLLLPVMLLVGLLICLESRGSPIFKQVRVGIDNGLFTMYKFRSMRLDAEAGTGARWAEKNDTRVTFVGRIIRKVRLDELPQLWNILKGEMSFVGPRP